MPANLTPQYRRAEAAYRAADTAEEKIAALDEMLCVIPRHKGTEHIRGDLRKRLAKLRSAGSQRQSGGPDPFHIPGHGAGQIAVVGTANVGKSALVGAVSNARVKVAAFPFATHAPVPGMMPFEDVQIQLVDLPPLTEDGFVTGMAGALRNADALIVCLDLSADDLLEQAETCFNAMSERGIVRQGDDVPEGGESKAMLVVGTKLDDRAATDGLDMLLELRPDLQGLLPTSTETGTGLAELAESCFRLLQIVRVYSKEPGKPVDMRDPFTLPAGSTVVDLARAVHRGLAEDLRYARIWGSGKFAGQTVQRDHILLDRDVIELHL